MRFVYATSFELSEGATAEQALDVVGAWFDRGRAPQEVRSDLTDGIRAYPLERGTLDVQVLSMNGDRFWRGTWRHSHADDPTLDVVSEVSVGDIGGVVTTLIMIGLLRTRPQLKPLHYAFATPRLVRDLLKRFEIYDGNTPLLLTPTTLGAADVDGFVDDVLLDPERTRPVVFISNNPSQSAPSADAESLAANLAGIAHVYQTIYGLPNTLLRRRLGDLAVWGGAVRIYWPGFTLDGNPYLHSLFTANRLRSWQGLPFEEYLFRRISSIATATIGMLDTHRAFRRSALRTSLAAGQQAGEDFDTVFEELDKAETQNRELQDNVEMLTLERDEARDERDRLKDALALVQQTMSVELQPDAPELDEQPPESVREAVERAAARCPHLVFLDEAYESAARSEFRRPDEVLDALMALERLATLYARPTGIGKSPRAAAEALGLTWKGGVSDSTTGGSRTRRYERSWRGQTIKLGPHLALGGGSGAGLTARIYFYMSEDDEPTDRKIVVGHVGAHLPDSST